MPVYVPLPPDLGKRSWEFAALLTEGKNLAEWTPPGTRKTRMVAFGKMAECVVCVAVHLDPVSHLDWFNERKRGEGHDIQIGAAKLDVKHTFYGSRLIWPQRSNEKFDRLDFNTLGFVTGESEEGLTIEGVISKARFAAEKTISKGEYGIAAGTWYMHKESLDDPESLLPPELPTGVGWHICPVCGLQGPVSPGGSYCRLHSKTATVATVAVSA
jgi:hypothetical protein